MGNKRGIFKCSSLRFSSRLPDLEAGHYVEVKLPTLVLNQTSEIWIVSPRFVSLTLFLFFKWQHVHELD